MKYAYIALFALIFVLGCEGVPSGDVGADCGTDVACFRSNAETCSPAFIDYTYDPIVMHLNIVEGTPEDCTLKVKIKEVDVPDDVPQSVKAAIPLAKRTSMMCSLTSAQISSLDFGQDTLDNCRGTLADIIGNFIDVEGVTEAPPAEDEAEIPPEAFREDGTIDWQVVCLHNDMEWDAVNGVCLEEGQEPAPAPEYDGDNFIELPGEEYVIGGDEPEAEVAAPDWGAAYSNRPSELRVDAIYYTKRSSWDYDLGYKVAVNSDNQLYDVTMRLGDSGIVVTEQKTFQTEGGQWTVYEGILRDDSWATIGNYELSVEPVGTDGYAYDTIYADYHCTEYVDGQCTAECDASNDVDCCQASGNCWEILGVPGCVPCPAPEVPGGSGSTDSNQLTVEYLGVTQGATQQNVIFTFNVKRARTTYLFYVMDGNGRIWDSSSNVHTGQEGQFGMEWRSTVKDMSLRSPNQQFLTPGEEYKILVIALQDPSLSTHAWFTVPAEMEACSSEFRDGMCDASCSFMNDWDCCIEPDPMAHGIRTWNEETGRCVEERY